MDPTLKIALVAAASAIAGGFITGIIAPHIAWGIEQKKQRMAYRRELIANWRSTLTMVLKDCESNPDQGYFWRRVEKFASFTSLRPQLSTDSHKEMRAINDNHECYLFLIKKVGEIEKKWELL
jgi:hypothetical protein